jgi:hypothetical protein
VSFTFCGILNLFLAIIEDGYLSSKNKFHWLGIVDNKKEGGHTHTHGDPDEEEEEDMFEPTKKCMDNEFIFLERLSQVALVSLISKKTLRFKKSDTM